MRNRALHDALRDFALEAAALLTDDVKAGAEIEFDVVDEAYRRGPVLYRYQPRTQAFIAERWERLRETPACARACAELGAGAAAWLRVNGLRGEQAEPALQAMLERLYEDATSFGFPEERFERVYREVESTLYRGCVRACVIAPLPGAWIEAERVDLGDGLSLVRGDRIDAPPEAVWPEAVRSERDGRAAGAAPNVDRGELAGRDAGAAPGAGDPEPAVLCVLERDTPADEPIPTAEAEERFRRLVTALRLWAPGAVGLGALGWRRVDDGRWSPVPLRGSAPGRDVGWTVAAGEESGLRQFVAAIDAALPGRRAGSDVVAWALSRFDMGCERAHDDEALSDYLLAMRALLDATSDAGEASLALRVAALCAEEGQRRVVQRRVEAALGLERLVMGGTGGVPAESPRQLVAMVEGHVRALLRDVLCGYLEPDLRGVADDILLETRPEPFVEIEARDLRSERAAQEAPPEQETSELEPVAEEQPAEPAPPAGERPAEPEPLDGVTRSADWGWGEPEDYSAPV
jgi:hypothetical protein